MRARLLVLVVAVVAACGSATPKPTPVTQPVANTAPQPVTTPAPAPAPAGGQFCWISQEPENSRKSGCTKELDQCQKDADEMRSRPDTKIAQECAKQSPVHCYVFADEPTPLCYASLQDCNDGRGRMADFGTTTECQTTP